jgi:ATP-dependent helicase/nuclease subunit A
MVDEYQDVNAVQEMIFTAVSRSGRNLFMVGDVKQSIYRFRLADLSIFLDKFQRFSDTPDPDAPGERILLRENFRSRKSVLYAANHVFSNIMSHELGEIDYDESAVLIYGATGYPDGEEASAELDIIDPEGGSDDEEAPERLEQEARFVAGKIRELVDSAVPVYENGVPRPCTWGDFAVLLRSPSGSGAIFHRVLTGEGIPVQSRQGLGFFTSLEVTVAINMLSLIDNPHADVPLISVLRSPAFAFDADELSSIRGCDRTGDYYSALCAAAEGGDEKCRAFLLTLNRLRAAAPDMELGELLWRVYTETDLFALCLAMTDGETRRGNLMRLFEYARSFESGGGNGVFAFVSWLRRLEERGEEPEIAPEGDAVRIMSIHKSKGLEFPFVFLSDLSHRFNKRDMTSPVLLHTDLGLGLKMTDTARGIEYPTLARRAVESRMLREMLSEEMRVLYVGMTRAKERLFMTCTIKNAEKAISALAQDLTSPIPPERLLTASSFAQWLIQCALLDEGELIKLNIALPGHGGQIQDSAADEAAGEDDACYQLLKSRLDFAYPYADASRLPSKLTATGLKGRVGEAEITGEAQEISPPPVEYSFRRAELGSGERLDAAERGTATHMLLQYMDLHATATRESILGELQRLTASGHLTAEQAKAVNVGAIMRFGASPLCRRIMSADEVHREFRFTLLSSAGDYFDAADGEQLLLQGVVDCFIVENGKITVIDYKTDRVTQEEVPGRAEHYAPQVRAYARALERICKLPVAQCLVYFLSIGECCTVEI